MVRSSEKPLTLGSLTAVGTLKWAKLDMLADEGIGLDGMGNVDGTSLRERVDTGGGHLVWRTQDEEYLALMRPSSGTIASMAENAIV